MRDIAAIAMLLLAALIVVGLIEQLMVVTRCVIWPAPVCDRDFGLFRWINDSVAVLIALIGSRRRD